MINRRNFIIAAFIPPLLFTKQKLKINKINLPENTKALQIYLTYKNGQSVDICTFVIDNKPLTPAQEKTFQDFVKNNIASKKDPNVYLFYKNNKLVNTLLFDGNLGNVAYQLKDLSFIYDKI